MKYYLKKCGFQELGSVGDDGKSKRGRYLMTSMNKEVLSIFPPLSRDILNDCAVLPVVPLHTGKKTYCNFIYHNDKFNGSTARHKRNEYRIYLNREMEGQHNYLEFNDIVIMRSEEILSEGLDNSEQIIYYMDVLKDHSSGEYIRLSRYIENYPISGGYAVLDEPLDFFEEKVEALKDAQYDDDISIDESVTKRIVQTSSEKQTNLFNPATFRDFVLAGYGNACALTGKKVTNYDGIGIDVVYIKPRSEGGTCLPSNGLAISKELSLFFVRGYFTLSDKYEIIVHPRNPHDVLNALHLKQIRVPPNAFFQPDHSNLEYHREYVYGTFDCQ